MRPFADGTVRVLVIREDPLLFAISPAELSTLHDLALKAAQGEPLPCRGAGVKLFRGYEVWGCDPGGRKLATVVVEPDRVRINGGIWFDICFDDSECFGFLDQLCRRALGPY